MWVPFVMGMPGIAGIWVRPGTAKYEHRIRAATRDRPYNSLRVFRVVRPAGRVVRDVLPDAVQGFFVANDVFEIIALPQSPAKR